MYGSAHCVLYDILDERQLTRAKLAQQCCAYDGVPTAKRQLEMSTDGIVGGHSYLLVSRTGRTSTLPPISNAGQPLVSAMAACRLSASTVV
ncbi:MAG TPA: hypothetical protein VEA16_07740 [Vicinamibacterales bacterium]|nr:hypothetical protein [Vicinamibacterales bacterium]